MPPDRIIPSNEEPLLPTNKKTILRQNDKVAHVIRAIAACVQGSGMSNWRKILTAIPRHREIVEFTAVRIFRQLDIPEPWQQGAIADYNQAIQIKPDYAYQQPPRLTSLGGRPAVGGNCAGY